MGAKDLVLILQYVAIGVLFFELIFVMCQKPSEIQKHLIILIVASILMFTGYNIELSSYNIDEAIAGIAVSYMGKPYIMLASFMFICSFYKFKVPKWVLVVLNIIGTFFCILVFWNQSHFLYYATVEFDATQKYSPLLLTRGPLYITYVVTTVAYFIACVVVIIRGIKSAKNKAARNLNTYIIAMVVCGISGYVVYLSGDANGYDTTMVGVFFGVLCLLAMFIRCKIFDVTSIGKDQALEDSPTGLIVFDSIGRLSYTNSSVEKYLDDQLTIDFLYEVKDSNFDYVKGNKAYSIVTKPLTEKNQIVGKAIEITDISDRYHYQTKLEQEVEERTEKLANIQREIIASVANIIEARSVETGEHIKRTSAYTEMIAKELVAEGQYLDTLSEDYIEMLVAAAPLHDIGKIAVPDYILLKPGMLSSDEFECMKTHVDSGSEIIRKTMQGIESEEYINMAADIAQYHHERWDGTGYTQSMKGDEIPLSARIVAVADCFDAITSERCYKQAISKEEGLALIISESGSHFDPTVVKAFETAIKRSM